MFDLGSWGEFLILVVAVLVLIGPKEMPRLLTTAGRWVYRAKKAFRHFRQTYEPYLEAGEIEEYIKDVNESVLQKDTQQKEIRVTKEGPNPQPQKKRAGSKAQKERSSPKSHKERETPQDPKKKARSQPTRARARKNVPRDL